MTLAVDKFLRRFLLHLLPRSFVRIRNFGFLANRQRATLLPLCYRVHPIHQPLQLKLSERRSFRHARSAVERCTSSNG